MLFTDDEEDELKKVTRHLKWWRLILSTPFLLGSLVLMGVVWLMLRAAYFVTLTTVQVQGFAGPENKRFHRFRAWIRGGCYDCQQLDEEENGDDGDLT